MRDLKPQELRNHETLQRLIDVLEVEPMQRLLWIEVFAQPLKNRQRRKIFCEVTRNLRGLERDDRFELANILNRAEFAVIPNLGNVVEDLPDLIELALVQLARSLRVAERDLRVGSLSNGGEQRTPRVGEDDQTRELISLMKSLRLERGSWMEFNGPLRVF